MVSSTPASSTPASSTPASPAPASPVSAPSDFGTHRAPLPMIPADPRPLPCAHFDAHRCRSCTLIKVPTLRRIDDLQAQIAALLDPFAGPPTDAAQPAGSAQASDAGPPTDAAQPAGSAQASDAVPPTDSAQAAGSAQPTDSTRPTYWRSPVRSPESGFRNKAKMVAGGTAESPTFGLLDEDGSGIDLSDCPLYPPSIHTALDALPALIRRAQVAPYDVARRRGELKHVLVTTSDSGELMVRFVLRTRTPVPRLAEHIRLLTDAVASHGFFVRVVTANLQPDHAAILEGPEEVHIWGDDALTVRQGRIPLRVRPQSFLQTNTVVASQLYEQVATWVDQTAAEAPTPSLPDPPFVVWDLFCGVGGFALHCARQVGDTSRRVIGVEVSAQAIESATRTARELGLAAEFTTADAALFARDASNAMLPTNAPPATNALPPTSALPHPDALALTNAPPPIDAPPPTSALPHPDLLIVNPPRRGLGHDLAEWIEESGINDVVYSSCNPKTLAKDLGTMRSYRITEARLLDMFPHTAHAEVVVRLIRAAPPH